MCSELCLLSNHVWMKAGRALGLVDEIKDGMDHLSAVKQLWGILSCQSCAHPWEKCSMSANLKCPFDEEGQKDQPLLCSSKGSYSASPAGLVFYFPSLMCWRLTLTSLCFFSARYFFLPVGNWSQLSCSAKSGVSDAEGNGAGMEVGCPAHCRAVWTAGDNTRIET